MTSKVESTQNDGNSSSEDESPEVVSSVQMKSEREKEIRELFAQKQKLKEEAKEKRRQKLEKLKLQKKAKLALESQRTEEIDEDLNDLDGNQAEVEISVPIKGKHRTFQDDDGPISEQSPAPIKKKLKRVYPKYNIEVEPLTRVQDPRAAAAISFKEKRLAKVPREKCASTILSYREKLLARNN